MEIAYYQSPLAAVLLALMFMAALANVTVAAPASALVTGATVSQVPTDPVATSRYTISFQTLSQLSNGVDTIIIALDNEIGVPNPLNRIDITISSHFLTGGGTAGEELMPPCM